jgi:hypothetical protein
MLNASCARESGLDRLRYNVIGAMRKFMLVQLGHHHWVSSELAQLLESIELIFGPRKYSLCVDAIFT